MLRIFPVFFFLFFFVSIHNKKHKIHAIFSFVHNTHTKTGYWLCVCVYVRVRMTRVRCLKEVKVGGRRSYSAWRVFGGHRTSCTTLITFTFSLCVSDFDVDAQKKYLSFFLRRNYFNNYFYIKNSQIFAIFYSEISLF